MPADHGLRPDDLQSVQHARCQRYNPANTRRSMLLSRCGDLRRSTLLMTKRQDLCLQRRSRPEQSDQRQANQPANISHQPRASPDSTSLASRIEFPTMTPPGSSLTVSLTSTIALSRFSPEDRRSDIGSLNAQVRKAPKNRLRQTTNGSEPKASPDQSLSLSRTHVRLKNGSARPVQTEIGEPGFAHSIVSLSTKRDQTCWAQLRTHAIS
jgi:hypothetical protein